MGIAAGIHPALYGKVTLPQRPEQPIQAEAPAAKAEPSKRRTMRRAPKKAEPEKAQHQNSKETKTAAPRGKKRGQNSGAKKPSIRIYFLGGLNEIGKNFTLYECEGDMLITCATIVQSFMLVITQDEFSTRWAKNVVKVSFGA